MTPNQCSRSKASTATESAAALSSFSKAASVSQPHKAPPALVPASSFQDKVESVTHNKEEFDY